MGAKKEIGPRGPLRKNSGTHRPIASAASGVRRFNHVPSSVPQAVKSARTSRVKPINSPQCTGQIPITAITIAVMGIWPVHWGELIGFTLLVLALFTAWGTLLGTWLKRRTPLAALAIGLCVPLFFLSGPLGPISFFAPIEQLVARVFPVYYAIVVLQHAFHDFTLNTNGIGINVLILAAYALGGLVLATIVVRRSTLAH